MIKRKKSQRTRQVPLSLLALLGTSSGFAQEAARAPAAQPSPEADSDVVVLSPFEVTASEDKGYYAENTLAGSRLRSSLSDLASSITVVTKQQLQDTAAVNINDVFMYEANTEGANTYTATGSNRDPYNDVIAGFSGQSGQTATSNTANRVRGLTAPDASRNFYSAISRIPFDTYNTQSVEISRGPNSILAGMGSVAGIVNQSTTNAALGVRHSSVSAQVSSWGGAPLLGLAQPAARIQGGHLSRRSHRREGLQPQAVA